MSPTSRSRADGLPLWAGAVTLSALVGIAVAVGGFGFVYAQGASYLGHDPVACANCHVMREHYEAWSVASHRSVAVCNDCHAPASLLPKYYTKAKNGWNHSVAFTTGEFPEPIRITEWNKEVTEGQCRHCHAQVVEAIDFHPGEGERLSCIRCHATVGHAK
jgi:cytochrome c nitrite reductase small subunit